MDFATWVQTQIDEFDITIYQISRRSGVHASTIANWLNGAKPQAAKAKAVKIALDEIVKEKQALSSSALPPQGVKKAPTETSERELDMSLIKRLVQLTPDEMEKVDAFVQGLLASRQG